MKTSFRSLLALSLSLVAHVAAAQHSLVRPTTVAQLRQQAAAPAAARRGSSTTVLRPGLVVSYAYNDSTRTWVRPKKTVFRYDAAGRTIQQTESDSATNRSRNQTFTTYNAAGQVTERRLQLDLGTGAGWENANRTLTTYNAAGLVTETLNQYNFLGGLGAGWENENRELSTYDSRNELIERRQEKFQSIPRTWRATEGTRYLNTYNAGNFITEQVVQVYRSATAAYADSARILSTRAATGEWTEAIAQEPNGSGGWRNQERTTNAVWFNYAQQQLASADVQDWDGAQWQTAGRLRGTFTATSSDEIYEEFVSGRYVNSARQFVSYDAYANLLNALFADWNGAAWVSIIEVRNQYAYNPDQSLRRSIASVDFGGSGLQLAQLANYFNYQAIVLASRAALAAGIVQAYPNPSPDGRFTLLLSAPAATGEICVFDALGRQVARDAWAGAPRANYALSLTGQPAGLYTVRVQTAAGRITQRVCIR